MTEQFSDEQFSDEQIDDGQVGADREEARDAAAAEQAWGDPDAAFPSGLGADDATAAEQGNRDGDEMAAEGYDPGELADLAGDDQDLDELGGVRRDESAAAVDLDGTDGGEDPLAGEAIG